MKTERYYEGHKMLQLTGVSSETYIEISSFSHSVSILHPYLSVNMKIMVSTGKEQTDDSMKEKIDRMNSPGKDGHIFISERIVSNTGHFDAKYFSIT